jgi:hypothetical protein
MLQLSSNIAVCICCSGPTYRQTTLDKLNNVYIDHPNVYYFIITDDKEFFRECTRENLTVNTLEELQADSILSKQEYYLQSTSIEDYGEKFNRLNWKYPFFSNRFHFLQVLNYQKAEITNLFFTCTDATVKLERLSHYEQQLMSEKNSIGNIIGRAEGVVSQDPRMQLVADFLKSEYNIAATPPIMKYDGAGRCFIFNNKAKIKELFEIYNNTIKHIYNTNKINLYVCPYAYMDEPILAVIANSLGIQPHTNHNMFRNILSVQHNPTIERWFKLPG